NCRSNTGNMSKSSTADVCFCEDVRRAGAAGGLERTFAPALTMTRGRNIRGNTHVMAGRSLLQVNWYNSLRQIKLIIRAQTYRDRVLLLSGGRRVVRDDAMPIAEYFAASATLAVAALVKGF